MTSRLDAHNSHFHRDSAYPQPCRAATTATITIATALNNGDTLDGLTLATGDRVLVKNQSTGSQNGIYIVGATPARADDMDTGLEAWGAIIRVQAGTVNANTTWANTNTSRPTIDSTALTFATVLSGLSLALDDLSDVTITAPVTGDYLRYNGSVWVNAVLPQPVVEDDGAGSFAFVFEANGEVIWE